LVCYCETATIGLAFGGLREVEKDTKPKKTNKKRKGTQKNEKVRKKAKKNAQNELGQNFSGKIPELFC